MGLGGLVLGSPILYLKGMRILMFWLLLYKSLAPKESYRSGGRCRPVTGKGSMCGELIGAR